MPKRVDANQSEIVTALRQAGCSVQDLHEVGHGCGDILVGRNGINYVLEIKAPGGKLNEREREWHSTWRGQVAVVHSAEEALKIINGE